MNCRQIVPVVGNTQTIAINRGTSLKLKAQRKDYNNNPITIEAEGVYFVIKKCWKDKEALVKIDKSQMTFDEQGYYHFTILPEMTENLDYGKYVWDFTATEDSGNYRAKPSRGYFVIGNSACWIVNESEE